MCPQPRLINPITRLWACTNPPSLVLSGESIMDTCIIVLIVLTSVSRCLFIISYIARLPRQCGGCSLHWLLPSLFLTWHVCGISATGAWHLGACGLFWGGSFWRPPSFPSSHLLGVTAGALQATCVLGSCGVPPTH